MREGWTYKQIGEIADITDYVANGSFASLRENVSYKSEKDYAVLVRLADFSNEFDASKFVYVDEHAYNFLAKSKLYGGEIIMSNVGSIGKLFICPDLGMPMSLAPNTIVINTKNNRFYAYLFASSHCQAQIKSISSQTSLPKFNKTTFKKLSVPVPPIQEQEKIVAELDCLTGIIEKKKQQLEELDKLAQSVFYDMFGDPITNEKGWEVKKLGEICSAITKGTTPTTLGFNFSNTGINFIKIESIAEDGSFVWEKFAHIPEECDKLMARSQLQNGDILFSIAGALGRCAIVNETILPGNTNQALAIIRLLDKGKEMLKYVEYYLRSQYVRRLIETLKTGVAQLNLSLGQIKQMLIVLPPVLYLQDFYVKAKAIEKQKELVKQSIVETETLFNSRMDYWFN